MAMKKPPVLISIIIPVYNGEKTIGYCLESIFKSFYELFECIIVDDGSSDSTLDIAESYNTKIIKNTSKEGASHARNQGAEAAKGEILLFIDADVSIYPDTLDQVVSSFELNPHISALFGSYDDQPGCPNFLSQYRNLFHHYIHQTSNEDASTFWTGFGAVKKDAFLIAGKFDEACRMMEDIELGYKLKSKKFNILLVKNIVVKHYKHYSFLSLLKSDFFDRAIPWTVLMLKNKENTSDLNFKISHKLSAAIVMLLLLSLLISIIHSWAMMAAPVMLMLYLILNLEIYQFYFKKRGLMFSLKVIPLHLLYYVYSSLGFIAGTLKYHIENRSAQ